MSITVTATLGTGISVTASINQITLTSYAGTFPAVGKVELNEVYGPTANLTGTVTTPDVGDVLSGVTYGPSLSLTGTLDVVTPSGIAYQRPSLTGQVISQANNDDAWNLANNIYDYTPPANPTHMAELDHDNATAANAFLKLKNLNIFNNYDRFTDDAGGQIYTNPYAIDHLSGLGWWLTVQVSGNNWAAHLSNAAAATDGGFSDWRMPNISEWDSIQNANGTLIKWIGYAPFSQTGTQNWWTSTNNAVNPLTAAYYGVGGSNGGRSGNLVKSNTSQEMLLLRNHYT